MLCLSYLSNIRCLTRSSNISGQHFLVYKGTVDGTSSDPPFKDGTARFTTVTLKPLSDEKYEILLSFF